MILRICLALMLFLLSSAGFAQDEDLIPQPTASYTADQRIETEGQVMEAVIAVDGMKQRSEQVMAGTEVVTIVLPEDGRFFMIMPAVASFVNLEMQEEMGGGTPEMNVSGLEAEFLGEEEKNGEETLVFLITDESGVEGTAYITEDGIMVHFSSTDSQGNQMTIDRFNIERGEQEASLFEPPVGYQEITMDPEMVRQMQQQQQGVQ